MKRIKITYAQITPESASEGNFSETGWEDKEGVPVETAMEALWLLRNEGACEASSTEFYKGIWYSTGFGTIDSADGTEEERSFHLYGFTECEERVIWNEVTRRKNAS